MIGGHRDILEILPKVIVCLNSGLDTLVHNYVHCTYILKTQQMNKEKTHFIRKLAEERHKNNTKRECMTMYDMYVWSV